MVEEDVEVAIPPPSWVIAFFAFMLVLGLAMGSTEWGKSLEYTRHLPYHEGPPSGRRPHGTHPGHANSGRRSAAYRTENEH